LNDANSGDLIANRYRLIGLLGHGGMGRVWKARDQKLQLDVAVKQVRQDPAATDARRRAVLAYAEKEARHAAKLRDHPNVVAVHDVVEHEGLPWIVMQFVAGVSLADSLQAHGPVTPQEAARIGLAVLNALKAAHTIGVVHRDVKPANIMITADGGVLLSDFGIAKHQSDTSLTATGMLVGSVPYMAPERLKGGDSPSADLFSLGVTLYEALEGICPFQRDNPLATMQAVGFEEAPVPVHAGVLTDLVMALMRKDPTLRPDIPAAQTMLASIDSLAVKVSPRCDDVSEVGAAATASLPDQYAESVSKDPKKGLSGARALTVTAAIVLSIPTIFLILSRSEHEPPSIDSLPSPCAALTADDPSELLHVDAGHESDGVASDGPKYKSCRWPVSNESYSGPGDGAEVWYWTDASPETGTPVAGIPNSRANSVLHGNGRTCYVEWETSYGRNDFRLDMKDMDTDCETAQEIAVEISTRLPH
jgi:serine/threonine protein kinase